MVAVPALLVSATFVLMATPASAAEPSVLYVDNSHKCSDTGTGSQELPYCSLQKAADVVDPGQTVAVRSTTPGVPGGFTFTRSGTPDAPITFTGNAVVAGGPPTTLNGNVVFVGVHDVTLTNIGIGIGFSPVRVQVTGSARVTVDRVTVAYGATKHVIDIDGGSSNVTVSRTSVTGPSTGPTPAVRVEPGATRITLTTNELTGVAGDTVSLSGVTDAVVTSNNLVNTGCGSGVAIDGDSSAVVENNRIGLRLVGECGATDLSVSADSVDGVHADYNTEFVASGDANPEYNWGGATYPTPAAFHAATGQGAHDFQDNGIATAPPLEHWPVIDSADANAPGELPTDYNGKPRVDDPLVADTGVGSPAPDRGAFEREDTFDLANAITVSPASGPASLTVSYTRGSAPISTWSEPVTLTANFGDGSADVPVDAGGTVTHTYAAPSTYTVTTTATDVDGNRAVDTRTVSIAPPPPSVPPLTAAPTAFYNPHGYQGTGLPELYVNAGGNLYQRAFLVGLGWTEWTNLGGDTLTGQVTVDSEPSTGNTEVFANSGGHLVENYRANDTWSGWTDLGGTIDGQPTVFHNPKYRTTEVYARSGTHVIYKYNSGGTWSGWIDLGGNISGDPAVIYNQKYGTTEIYARSGISAVYEYYSGTSWSGWNNLDGNLSGDPTVFYDTSTGRTEIYARSGSQLWYRSYFGTAWSGWTNLGGNVSGDPAVIYNRNYDTTEVYERSGTDVEYAYSSTGTTFSGWTTLGGNATSDPSVSYYVEGLETQVFVSSNGHPEWTDYVPQWGAWSPWEDLTQ
jgi:hypothetical protein